MWIDLATIMPQQWCRFGNGDDAIKRQSRAVFGTPGAWLSA
jgi:hypothetical protein